MEMEEEAGTEFLKRSPIHEMRRLAERHLYGKTTPREIERLHQNPQLWLRTLYAIRKEVEAHIAQRKVDLDGMKPPVLPEREYISARAQFSDERSRRLNFRKRVINHISEVTALCGSEPMIDCKIIGDVVAAFVEISMAAELGDMGKVREISAYWANVVVRAQTQQGK